MSNKSTGNHFEKELCELLFNNGFWVLNVTQNSAGQPADVIAVKDGKAYLIDCKICSGKKFQIRRIEENQDLSMKLWNESGNGLGLFAIKINKNVYMVDIESLKKYKQMDEDLLKNVGKKVNDWIESCNK